MRTAPPNKVPVDPQRIRSMPRQFAPIDRRLVYEKHLQYMSLEAIALLTFLECVSDPEGLSFYSDPRICKELDWNANHLSYARDGLIDSGFLLYRKPFYQVLDLPPARS